MLMDPSASYIELPVMWATPVDMPAQWNSKYLSLIHILPVMCSTSGSMLLQGGKWDMLIDI